MDRQLEELCDVDDDAEEEHGRHVGHDPRPLGARQVDRIVVLDRLRHRQVPFHGQAHGDVDAAAEVDVAQRVEEVDYGQGVEGGQLDDEGLLDALDDRQDQEDAVERGQKDLNNCRKVS